MTKLGEYKKGFNPKMRVYKGTLTKEDCLNAHHKIAKALVETDYVDGIANHSYQGMKEELDVLVRLIYEHFLIHDVFKGVYD